MRHTDVMARADASRAVARASRSRFTFMTLDLAEIARLFAERGGVACAAEPVSPLEHALQCAWLAEQARCDDAPRLRLWD